MDQGMMRREVGLRAACWLSCAAKGSGRCPRQRTAAINLPPNYKKSPVVEFMINNDSK
jgi:hypothetical protein